EHEARQIGTATGSAEARPPIPGLDLPGVIGSTEALALDAVPESIAIIGGGPVGVEFASVFATFGATVTVIEMVDRLLPLEDADLGNGLRRALQRQGIAVKTSAKVGRATAGGPGF